MHDADARALRRATALLVVLSLLRYGWTQRGAEPPHDSGAEAVLHELVDSVASATAQAERRALPLAEGERLDPNRASEVELDRLPGVGPSTARAIVDARGRGTRFDTQADLLVVRGIGPATLERLRPHLALPPSSGPSGGARPGRSAGVDINRAGLEELQRLPGVGPAIAARIVARREKHLFTSVEDLLDVRGIGPATLEGLRAQARVPGSR